MNSRFIVLLCISFIYVLILAGFNRARQRFAGGTVGRLINLILVTTVLLLLSDYMLLFEQYLTSNIIFITQTLLKTAALSFLAFGGIRIAGS